MSKPEILIPVDGSDHSKRAVEYALKMANPMDAQLLLIHCHKPFPVTLGEPYFQKAIDKIMENSNRLIAPFITLIEASGLPFSHRIMEGSPGATICDIARIQECEMIIMGSRGISDLKGLFLGSVAHRVLQTAPCPVLVVK